MMTNSDASVPADWQALNERLVAALKPFAAPLAISFPCARRHAASLPRRAELPRAETSTAGRGRSRRAACSGSRGRPTPSPTVAADHANCSVGSYTHGFISLEEAATKDDVGAVLEAGLGRPGGGHEPAARRRPAGVGRLRTAGRAADDPGRRAAAHQRARADDAEGCVPGDADRRQAAVATSWRWRRTGNTVAASVGCALSRSRTGMRSEEMDLRHSGRAPGGGCRDARSGPSGSTARWRATPSADAKRFR